MDGTRVALLLRKDVTTRCLESADKLFPDAFSMNDEPRSPFDESLREITRRHFFREAGFGIGSLALTSLVSERLFAFTPEADAVLSQAARAVAPKIAVKAKQVIYLFMRL